MAQGSNYISLENVLRGTNNHAGDEGRGPGRVQEFFFRLLRSCGICCIRNSGSPSEVPVPGIVSKLLLHEVLLRKMFPLRG